MWPSEVSNWWDREEVREGLGLIITTVALLLMTLTPFGAVLLSVLKNA